jgi:hypothetical protein
MHNVLKKIAEKRKMEIDKFYKAEPMVRAMEEIDSWKEPLEKLKKDLESGYATNGVKLTFNNRIVAKFKDVEVSKVMVETMIDSLDKIKKQYETKVKKI